MHLQSTFEHYIQASRMYFFFFFLVFDKATNQCTINVTKELQRKIIISSQQRFLKDLCLCTFI